jgi:glycerol-3-phosphate acyltransferase PlsY
LLVLGDNSGKIVLSLILFVLIVFTHRKNIERIFKGIEPRLKRSKG